MRRLWCAALGGSLALALLLTGCGGGNASTFNPTPIIQSLSPDSATAGGPSFTLFLTGVGFQANSQVFWNGGCVQASPPAATCATVNFNISSTQLSVTIPAADIASQGIAQITVSNPAPGGGASIVAATFTINPASNPAPTITSLAPSNTPALPPGQTLNITVSGTKFISTSTVAVNGNPRATQFVSATQLTATLLSPDVDTNGTLNITVSNPAPGGGVSAPATFTVGPVPAIRVHSALDFSSSNATQLISVAALGNAANGAASSPAMSADGRYVAFYSSASNLVSTGASGNIFVRDTCAGADGCTPTTSAVDLGVNGEAPNGPPSSQVAISSDGRFVVFASTGTNLVTTGSSTIAPQIYVRDLCVGANAPASCAPQTILVSVVGGGQQLGGTFAAMSSDGRFIAFIAADSSVYLRDTCVGSSAPASCVVQTKKIADGAVNAPITLSADGAYVAFEAPRAAATNSVTESNIIMTATCVDAVSATACNQSPANISVDAGGALISGVNTVPSVSADGRFIVFQSTQTAASGSVSNIYLRDTCVGTSGRDACSPSTTEIASNAVDPAISASGRRISYVALDSSALAAAMPTGILEIYDTCFGADLSCVPGSTPVTQGTTASSSIPASAANAAVPAFDENEDSVAFTSDAAIGLLPYSGFDAVYTESIAP